MDKIYVFIITFFVSFFSLSVVSLILFVLGVILFILGVLKIFGKKVILDKNLTNEQRTTNTVLKIATEKDFFSTDEVKRLSGLDYQQTSRYLSRLEKKGYLLFFVSKEGLFYRIQKELLDLARKQ